jgi:hypothetical protein
VSDGERGSAILSPDAKTAVFLNDDYRRATSTVTLGECARRGLRLRVRFGDSTEPAALILKRSEQPMASVLIGVRSKMVRQTFGGVVSVLWKLPQRPREGGGIQL